MNQYALYLRKSRADLDAEARGEKETLSKHRAALTAYAKTERNGELTLDIIPLIQAQNSVTI